jgi:hypothetical protein
MFFVSRGGVRVWLGPAHSPVAAPRTFRRRPHGRRSATSGSEWMASAGRFPRTMKGEARGPIIIRGSSISLTRRTRFPFETPRRFSKPIQTRRASRAVRSGTPRRPNTFGANRCSVTTRFEIRPSCESTRRCSTMPASKCCSSTQLLQLYDEFYRPGKYAVVWFRWQGKPLVIAGDDASLTKEVRSLFTFRRVYWLGLNPGPGSCRTRTPIGCCSI